jgi:hypothetical protein
VAHSKSRIRSKNSPKTTSDNKKFSKMGKETNRIPDSLSINLESWNKDIKGFQKKDALNG